VPTTERCGGYPCATRPLVVPVPAALRSVSAGDARTCALAESGAVYCWGGGPKAIVNRWMSDTAAPRQVTVGRAFRSVSVSGHRACGVSVRGEVFCWSTTLGLPEDPAGREGKRLITSWFLAWTLGGAGIGVLFGYLFGRIRSEPWGWAGAIWGAIGGAAMGFVAGFVVGFFKVIGGLW
jgi:Regulator of Chromosome Condensation (RCC1) repeat protein